MSFLVGSLRYMDSYVNARLRHDGYALPFVYTTFERSSDNHRFLRLAGLGSDTFVSRSRGLPSKYRAASYPVHLYRLNHRLVF